MFGFVTADTRELSQQERSRYTAVYCGICRSIRAQSSNLCRLSLSYDMAFLALLLMSLYEPREQTGKRACMLHPIKPRPWVENEVIRYCADMNVALAYYKAMDDYQDEKKRSAKILRDIFGVSMDNICQRWPRQCKAIDTTIRELSQLEIDGCDNPDLPAACFGKLMAELFVYQQDQWSENLRQMGMALGRYIYLADAAIDYRRDEKKGSYNPFLAMKTGQNWERWEEYLVLAMGRCADHYERLPLVQDKKLLDNILYSGVWLSYRRQQQGASKQ